MGDMRAGYRCAPCEKFWDRPGNTHCDCGKPGQKILWDGDGKNEHHVIKRTDEAPMRLVIAEDENDRSFGMLECGHTYADADRRTSLMEVGRFGCVDCWKEDNTPRRRGAVTRNRLMVGVRAA